MKDLGTKYVCFKCQAKFYDLKRPAPLCPKCGADQREMPAVVKTDRKKPPAPPPSRLEAVQEREEPVAEEVAEEEEEEDEEEAKEKEEGE